MNSRNVGEGVNLCGRCGDRSCCRIARVFVTRGDIRRICEATGQDGFWEQVPLPAPDAAALDPIWAAIFAGGRAVRTLRYRPAGGCVFLTPAGCRLPAPVRPLVCRLYPFDYTAGTIKGVYAPLCPWPEQENAPLLLALLGMNRDVAEKWRQQLYREIGEEFED